MFSREDTTLVELVTAKVESSQVRVEWVKHVFGKQLRHIQRSARTWRTIAFWTAMSVAGLGVLSAIGGALGKGVKSGNAWSVAGIVAGSLVTAITGFSHARQPDVEGAVLDETRKLMRREGWDFLQGLNQYKAAKDGDAAYALFVHRISELVARRSPAAAGRPVSQARPRRAGTQG